MGGFQQVPQNRERFTILRNFLGNFIMSRIRALKFFLSSERSEKFKTLGLTCQAFP